MLPKPYVNYNNIRTVNEWYGWLEETLIPNVRVQPWYNGAPPYGLRGYMNDRVSRLIGYAIVRQVREEMGACRFLFFSLFSKNFYKTLEKRKFLGLQKLFETRLRVALEMEDYQLKTTGIIVLVGIQKPILTAHRLKNIGKFQLSIKMYFFSHERIIFKDL